MKARPMPCGRADYRVAEKSYRRNARASALAAGDDGGRRAHFAGGALARRKQRMATRFRAICGGWRRHRRRSDVSVARRRNYMPSCRWAGRARLRPGRGARIMY